MSEPVDEFTRKFMRDFNKYLLPREKEITSRLKILEARNKLDIETLSSFQIRFEAIEEKLASIEKFMDFRPLLEDSDSEIEDH